MQLLEAVEPNGLEDIDCILRREFPLDGYGVDQPLVTLNEDVPSERIPGQASGDEHGIRLSGERTLFRKLTTRRRHTYDPISIERQAGRQLQESL